MEMAMIPLPRRTCSAGFYCEFSGAAKDVAHSFWYQRHRRTQTPQNSTYLPQNLLQRDWATGLHFVDSYSVMLVFAKTNAFAFIYQKLWHICALAAPVKKRPNLKRSPVKDPADFTLKSSYEGLLTCWLHVDL